MPPSFTLILRERLLKRRYKLASARIQNTGSESSSPEVCWISLLRFVYEQAPKIVKHHEENFLAD